MAKEKCIGCFFVSGNILLAAFIRLPFVLFFVVKKNATQSTLMTVNKKRKQMHQMHVNVCMLACVLTRVCPKIAYAPVACVLYISLMFSNARRVLPQCNTRLRLLYLLTTF